MLVCKDLDICWCEKTWTVTKCTPCVGVTGFGQLIV